MGIRRWLRRIERDAKESADTIVLVDSEPGAEVEAPRDVFLRILASFGDDAPDPAVVPLLDRLDRLIYRDTGDPFWLEDMTHTGKAAANTEEEHRGGVDPHFR